MTSFPVFLVSASTVWWSLLYVVLYRLNPSHGKEWNCRLVTLLHGCLIVPLSAYIGFIAGPWPFTHPGGPNSELQVFALSFCLGYFIFDLLWCVSYGNESIVMLAHHIISILGLVGCLFLGVSATETNGVIFGSEITNPLLQLRWFLRKMGRYEDTNLGLCLDATFVTLFFCVRMGVGTILLVCVLRSPTPILVMKISGVGMYTISWLFMVNISKYVMRRYRKLKQARKPCNVISSSSPAQEDSEIETAENGLSSNPDVYKKHN
ncbi:TLC domain-containing protein 5-like [Lethenteron reissneri]|uniref:TLC domain-containing protein 5-like n=1 Tax=Lethenteron reissneri TaxID=7753 RepID=UPI002AB642B3|nr:TLC domain-containing protein 5-like [Lethenteron reissneri]